MALLNFLYKDEQLVASLYAQIFQGRLAQVAHERANTQSAESEVGSSIKVISGKVASKDNFTESRRETIDPHDMVTLDVLTHLQQFAVDESEATQGSIVMLSGGMFLIPYNFRKCLLESGFEMNKKIFMQALKPSIPSDKMCSQLIGLAQKSCIGEENEVRFFIKSTTGNWYWGSLIEDDMTHHVAALQRTHGANPIPVNLVAIHYGGSSDDDVSEENELAFSRGLYSMVTFANNILAGDVKFSASLAPLAITLEIQANAVETV